MIEILHTFLQMFSFDDDDDVDVVVVVVVVVVVRFGLVLFLSFHGEDANNVSA